MQSAHTSTRSPYSPLHTYTQVGFPRRDPERLKVALENTHRLVWVRAAKQSRVARLGQLLGFARATRCVLGGAAVRRQAPAYVVQLQHHHMCEVSYVMQLQQAVDALPRPP